MGYVGKWGGWGIKWLIIRVFCFCLMVSFFLLDGVFVQCCLVVYLSVFRWCLLGAVRIALNFAASAFFFFFF